MHLDDSSLAHQFLKGVPDWFESIARNQKVTWEEAASPGNFVPLDISSVSPQSYVKLFQKKEFDVKEGQKVLNSDRSPLLPKKLLAEESGARQNLLSALNMTLAA